MQSELDLADSGFKVYLPDNKPSIVWSHDMTQLDKTIPINGCAVCILEPKLVEADRYPNIELITYVELQKIKCSAN